MFYDRFKRLCKERGIPVKKACSDLEISDETLEDWKKKEDQPSTVDLLMLKSYFNVSVEQLLGLEEPLPVKSKFEDEEYLRRFLQNNPLHFQWIKLIIDNFTKGDPRSEKQLEILNVYMEYQLLRNYTKLNPEGKYPILSKATPMEFNEMLKYVIELETKVKQQNSTHKKGGIGK